MKFLRRSINSKNTERDLKDAYKIEFEDLQIEQDKLEEDTASAKQILFDTKKEFLVETKKTTNDKHSGQPLLAEIEHILGKYGIDRAAFHGGDLVGNACRKLMSEANGIVDEVRNLVMQKRRVRGSDKQIDEICCRTKQVLLVLDGFISCMKTKRGHVTDEIIYNAGRYRTKYIELLRFLRLSVTVKDHIIEHHSVEQLMQFGGIGDLGEDAGERNHQMEAREDQKLGAVREFAKKENCKSVRESRNNDVRVEIKKEAILSRNKRTHRSGEKDNTILKKRKLIDDRKYALMLEVLTDEYVEKITDIVNDETD